MSIVTVRDFAGSEEASGVSTRGIELFAWVLILRDAELYNCTLEERRSTVGDAVKIIMG